MTIDAPREFASKNALIEYAERNRLVYAWEGTPAFLKWHRLLSTEQYKIVGVRTRRRGVRPTMLFAKTIVQAERGRDSPKMTAIKRAQRAVQREEAKKEKRAAEGCQGGKAPRRP